MVQQGLSPSVQQGDRADLCSEMPGVGGDIVQRLGHGAEQDGIDHTLVLECDLGRRRRQGEDETVVGHWQQLCLTCLEPFVGAPDPEPLRAVPIAT